MRLSGAKGPLTTQSRGSPANADDTINAEGAARGDGTTAQPIARVVSHGSLLRSPHRALLRHLTRERRRGHPVAAYVLIAAIASTRAMVALIRRGVSVAPLRSHP